jgi:ubiquinone biosynthesis protein UbiJ
MAKAELQAKKDLEPVVRELAVAKEENRQLRDQLERLAARLDALEDDKPKRHRRTIDEAA